MLNHEQCQALLREQDVTSDVTAHLQGCADCRAYQAKLAALDALLMTDEDVEPSAQFDQRVRAGVRPLPFWKRPLVLGPALAAALGMMVLVMIPRGPNEDELMLAQDAEMLADMDMLRELDAAEDFAVIASLQTLEK